MWLHASRLQGGGFMRSASGREKNTYGMHLRCPHSTLWLQLTITLQYSNSFLQMRHEPMGAAGAPTLPVRVKGDLKLNSVGM